MKSLKRIPGSCTVLLLLFPIFWCGCGYHTAANSVRIPTDVHTIAIPAFQNATTAFHIEQLLTEAVVREFLDRTQFRIVNQDNGNADAVLHGTVVYAQAYPATYDSQTGRASTAIVTVSMRVTLADRHGKVLYSNPSYSFRQQYQISREPSSFFQEETPALDRLAREFASTLVSNVLEAY